MITIEILQQSWTDLCIKGVEDSSIAKILQRMSLILNLWLDTPYVVGQRNPRIAADCLGFVLAFYDEMYRKEEPTQAPPINPGFRLHNRSSALRVMKKVLKQFPHHEAVKDDLLQPGDLIIVGPPKGGPGHPMIVGPQRNTIWHCMKPRVMMTGWGLSKDEMKIFKVLRAKDREKWM